MIIKSTFVSSSIKRKLEFKHKVSETEINEVIFYGKPIFIKSRGVYLSIGSRYRYLTIIFKYDHKIKQADIITAYPSSKWQINLYKKMKK